MAVEINSGKTPQVIAEPKTILEGEVVQTPTEDFLNDLTAADPESFNVCISCD